MYFVYRYIDLADEIIKYVGITNNLEYRIKQHEQDDWCSRRKWRIEYFETENKAEAYAFETHYINLYKTGEYFNKAQVGQGINKYLPEQKWIEYGKLLKEEKKRKCSLQKEIEKIQDEIKNKEYELQKLRETNSGIIRNIISETNTINVIKNNINDFDLKNVQAFPFTCDEVIFYYKNLKNTKIEFNSVLKDKYNKVYHESNLRCICDDTSKYVECFGSGVKAKIETIEGTSCIDHMAAAIAKMTTSVCMYYPNINDAYKELFFKLIEMETKYKMMYYTPRFYYEYASFSTDNEELFLETEDRKYKISLINGNEIVAMRNGDYVWDKRLGVRVGSGYCGKYKKEDVNIKLYNEAIEQKYVFANRPEGEYNMIKSLLDKYRENNYDAQN